jgi:branched-chain amino acid transport system permease protein
MGGGLDIMSAASRKLTQSKIVPFIVVGVIFVIVPLIVPSFFQTLLTRVLIYALFAMSLNLIWGYTGLISLGHAAYFGIGSYVTSVLIVRYSIDSFWLIIIFAIIVTAIMAAFFGIIALRVSGLYFLLVTLALGQLVYFVSLAWRDMTGGQSGIFGVLYPDLGISGIPWNATYLYFLVLVILGVCVYIMYRILQSPFGQALVGIRENKRRMRALGYNTWLYSYITFIIAGVFAGIAGVLFSYYLRGTTLTQTSLTMSTIVLLMVILGSTRVFWGPILGAVVVVLLEYFVGSVIPARWPMILGVIFVVSVIFLRGGIAIYLEKLWKKLGHQNQTLSDRPPT